MVSPTSVGAVQRQSRILPAQALNASNAGSFEDTLTQALEDTPEDLGQVAQVSYPERTSYGETMLYMMSNGGGLENMLLFLCMLMNGGDSEDSILSLMQQAQGMVSGMDTDSAEILRKSIMNARYSPSILDLINQNVFGNPPAGNTPYEYWKPCSPTLTNSMDERSAASYRAVLNQFNVTSNPRYAVNKQGIGDTYCNIYTWDVTSAMGAELPHWVDSQTGAPRQYPDTQGATEMTANRTYDWLGEHGADYGWQRVTEQQAQEFANAGYPTVGVYKNPNGHGHLQMICPSADGLYDPQRGVSIAQAGSKLTEYDYNGKSESMRRQTAYYVHA